MLLLRKLDLRLIARITSSVQAPFILYIFLGYIASNFPPKFDVTDAKKLHKFEGYDRKSRPRPF